MINNVNSYSNINPNNKIKNSHKQNNLPSFGSMYKIKRTAQGTDKFIQGIDLEVKELEKIKNAIFEPTIRKTGFIITDLKNAVEKRGFKFLGISDDEMLYKATNKNAEKPILFKAVQNEKGNYYLQEAENSISPVEYTGHGGYKTKLNHGRTHVTAMEKGGNKTIHIEEMDQFGKIKSSIEIIDDYDNSAIDKRNNPANDLLTGIEIDNLDHNAKSIFKKIFHALEDLAHFRAVKQDSVGRTNYPNLTSQMPEKLKFLYSDH